MTWNHRIIRRNHLCGEITFGIYETYYDAEGNVVAFSAEPRGIIADDFTGLRWYVEKLSECLAKPVIDYDTRQEVAVDYKDTQVGEDIWTQEGELFFKNFRYVEEEEYAAKCPRQAVDEKK